MSRPCTRLARLRLFACEDRAVPSVVVVNGTAGDDVITSQFSDDAAQATYRADVLVNGVAAYSFTGNAFHFPETSGLLSDHLVVNGLGGNDTQSGSATFTRRST